MQEEKQNQSSQPKKEINKFYTDLTNVQINDFYIALQQIITAPFRTCYTGIIKKQYSPIIIQFLNLDYIQDVTCFRHKQMMKRLARYEFQTMKRIDHPNILKCFNMLVSSKYKIMIIQNCNNKNLKQYIKEIGHKISEIQAIRILKQVISGLSQLHKLNIIQIHLSPQNIMMHNHTVKLKGFGFQNFIQEDQELLKKQIDIKAPEISKTSFYNLQAQSWSLGLLLFFMLFGYFPKELQKKQFPIKIPQNKFSKQINLFLQINLQQKPQSRCHWNKLIKLKIFKNNFQLISPIIYDPNLQNCIASEELSQKQIFYEKQKKQIVEELQKPYLIPPSLRFRKIEDSNDIKDFMQKIDFSEEKYYLNLEQTNLQILKTMWLYQNIFLKISEMKIKQRQVLQFQFLLINRCSCNLACLNIKQIQQKRDQISLQIYLIYNYTRQKIKEKWKQIQISLYKSQEKLSSMFWDKLKKLTNSENFKEKEKYFQGIQNVDYKKQEQISYIYHYYQENILQLIDKIYKKDSLLKCQMAHIEEILNLKFKKLKDLKITFLQRIQQLTAKSMKQQ